MEIRMYDLKVTAISDVPASGPDGMVRLGQGGGFSGQDDVVIDLHASQVLLIAERMGLVPEVEPDAKRTIAKLTRQIRTLRDHFERLDNVIRTADNSERFTIADLRLFSAVSLELADEFLADLPSSAADEDEGPKSVRKVADNTGTKRGRVAPGDLFEQRTHP